MCLLWHEAPILYILINAITYLLLVSLGMLAAVAYIYFRMRKDGYSMVKEQEVTYGNPTDC